MTTFLPKIVKCANCGSDQEVKVLTSTNSFGPCDFDLRPAPMARNTLSLRIEFCDKCEYGSHDISKISAKAKEVLDTKEYHDFIHSFVDNETVMAYLGDYYIQKAKEKYKEAYFSMRNVAWILDDYRNRLAKDARILALECFNKCGDNNFVIDERIAKVDMLRRAGLYQDAISYANELLTFTSDEMLVKILNYEISFAENKDDRCHSTGEIK